jgi:menaquinone-specific isochorismate synthase
VTALVDRLNDLCRELHWNSTPRVWKLKNVQHLLTPFTAILNKDVGILDIVKRLHPTAAVGGVPADRALELIGHTEGDRGWYAAPVDGLTNIPVVSVWWP